MIKASVLRPTEQQLKALAKEHGYTQQELFGRLLDWFATQPKARRVAILGGVSEEDLAAHVEPANGKRRGRARATKKR